MTLTVDVISDVICPWCYIGKRRLEKAVAASPRRARGAGPVASVPTEPAHAQGRHEPQGVPHRQVRKLGAVAGPRRPGGRGGPGRGHPVRLRQDHADAQHPRRPPPDRAGRHGGRAGRRGGGGLPGVLHRGPGHQPNDRPARRGGRGRAGPGPGRGRPERRRGLGGDPGGGRTGPPCRGAGRAVLPHQRHARSVRGEGAECLPRRLRAGRDG